MPNLVMELHGPNFMVNANLIATALRPGSIDELRVILGALTPESKEVKEAVAFLRPYLRTGAGVYFVSPSATPPSASPAPSSGSGPGLFLISPAAFQQMQNCDFANAQTVAVKMAANQNAQMERWQIIHDTQTKIYQVQQDVVQNKSTHQDANYKRWSDFMNS
jgi:hypothetical protein